MDKAHCCHENNFPRPKGQRTFSKDRTDPVLSQLRAGRSSVGFWGGEKSELPSLCPPSPVDPGPSSQGHWRHLVGMLAMYLPLL